MFRFLALLIRFDGSDVHFSLCMGMRGKGVVKGPKDSPHCHFPLLQLDLGSKPRTDRKKQKQNTKSGQRPGTYVSRRELSLHLQDLSRCPLPWAQQWLVFSNHLFVGISPGL